MNIAIEVPQLVAIGDPVSVLISSPLPSLQTLPSSPSLPPLPSVSTNAVSMSPAGGAIEVKLARRASSNFECSTGLSHSSVRWAGAMICEHCIEENKLSQDWESLSLLCFLWKTGKWNPHNRFSAQMTDIDSEWTLWGLGMGHQYSWHLCVPLQVPNWENAIFSSFLAKVALCSSASSHFSRVWCLPRGHRSISARNWKSQCKMC